MIGTGKVMVNTPINAHIPPINLPIADIGVTVPVFVNNIFIISCVTRF